MSPWTRQRRLAISSAARSLEIHLLHAGDRQDLPPVAIQTEPSLALRRAIRDGGTVETIPKEPETMQADLTVMTTEGHHGFLVAVRGVRPSKSFDRPTMPFWQFRRIPLEHRLTFSLVDVRITSTYKAGMPVVSERGPS